MAKVRKPRRQEPEKAKPVAVVEQGRPDPGKYILQIGTMAVLVARPLVAGEDPGFGSAMTNPGGTTLTMLWFVLAAAWSLWAVSRKKKFQPLGLADLGLAALAGFYFLSSEMVAAGLYSARLVSWEMLSYLACFLSMRFAAADEKDKQAIWNVLLATGFAVVAYGIYQYAWEMPLIRQKYGANLEQLRQDYLAQSGGTLEADAPFMEQLRQRMLQTHIYSTFSHPNTLGSFLTLLFPSALGAVWLAWRSSSRKWLVGGITLVGAGFVMALWFNFSRGAMAACALASVMLLFLWTWKRFSQRRGLLLMMGLGLLLACAGLYWGLNQSGLLRKDSSGGLGARIAYWKATIAMIEKHPWLGVGPGNFGNHYPRYMIEGAEEKIKDPHNFLLEAWSSAGVGAMVVLFLFVLYVLWISVREVRSSAVSESPEPPLPGWVAYLGGMFGLLLGFILRVEYQPGEDLVSESIGAIIRTGAWFFALAFLENLKVTGHQRRMLLLAGILAMLVNLGVSGSLAFPACMIPWVACLALSLNHSRQIQFPVFLLFPPLAALALYFLMAIFVPMVSAFTLGQQALRNGNSILAIPSGKGQAGKLDRVQTRVLIPLQQAVLMEPLNPRWQIQLASWYSVAFLEASLRSDPVAMQYGNACLTSLTKATRLDRESLDPLLARAQIRGIFAQRNKSEAFSQWMDASFALEQVILRDPQDARHHAQLALVYWQANKADVERGGKENCQSKSVESGKKSLRLEKLFQSSARHLTDHQRRQMEAIVGGKEPPLP